MTYIGDLAALKALITGGLAALNTRLDGVNTRLDKLAPVPPPVPPAPVIGPYPEIRPENAAANKRVPTAAELADWLAWVKASDQGWWFGPFAERVTGNYTGTTEEILEWAARKWEFDPDLAKAAAVRESTWRQATIGDGGESWSILQVRRGVWGGYPLTRDSTAFGADIWGAHTRCWLDGAGWFPGTAGSIRTAIACWFNPNDIGNSYADEVLGFLRDTPWRRAGF